MRGFIVGLCVLLWTTAAWGHSTTRPSRRGFTLEFGLGGNLVVEDDYFSRSWVFERGELDPLVGLSVGLLGRVNPFFSIGFLGHYGFLNPQNDNLREDYADFLAALLEARVHFGVRRFEPWFGFGLGYAMTHVQGERRPTDDLDVAVALHGVGFSVATGFNIYVYRHVAVGPFFRAILGTWPGVCYRVGTRDDCEHLDDHYGAGFDDVPHLISFGATVSNTF